MGQPEIVSLRQATAADARSVFEWRNDPWIVERSSSQRVLPWQEHLAWFTESLLREERLILIVERDGEGMGLARFDRMSENVAMISAYLLEQYTGRGYGVTAIRKGCEAAFDRWPEVRKILACVRNENRAGASSFRKAGFAPLDAEVRCPAAHDAFSLRRPQ